MCRVYHKAIFLIPRVIKYVRWRHFHWFFLSIRWFDWLYFDFVSTDTISRFRSYPAWIAHRYLYVYWITIVIKQGENTLVCIIIIMHYLTSILLKFLSAKIDNREPAGFEVINFCGQKFQQNTREIMLLLSQIKYQQENNL